MLSVAGAVLSVDGGMQQLVGDGLDAVLHRLEAGVEIALTRAQSWSKYVKDLVSYVERRSSMCKQPLSSSS